MRFALRRERFRPNVAALILCEDRFLACERTDVPGSLQSVQGGIEESDASPREAILRELHEELGAPSSAFSVIAQSRCWRRYRFPENSGPRRGDAVGQEQLWFEVRLSSPEAVRLHESCGEFSRVQLVDVLTFAKGFVPWKRHVVLDFLLERGHITLAEAAGLWEGCPS